MMSASELEQAIRRLPRSEVAMLLQRLDDLRMPSEKGKSDEVIAKWQVKGGFPLGMSADEYLRLIRDGDRD